MINLALARQAEQIAREMSRRIYGTELCYQLFLMVATATAIQEQRAPREACPSCGALVPAGTLRPVPTGRMVAGSYAVPEVPETREDGVCAECRKTEMPA